MGPKKRAGSDTEEQVGYASPKLIELLIDDAVLDKLKQVLYPKELSKQLKGLNDQIVRLQQQLAAKDEKIKTLEERVIKLEVDSDAVEQYSRRANLQIREIAECNGGEDTDQLVLNIINDNMGLVVE